MLTDKAKEKIAKEASEKEYLIPFEEYLTEICTTDRIAEKILAVFIKKAADLVAIGAFGGVTVDFLDTTIKLRPGTEDKPVKFSRSWKLEIEN